MGVEVGVLVRVGVLVDASIVVGVTVAVGTGVGVKDSVADAVGTEVALGCAATGMGVSGAPHAVTIRIIRQTVMPFTMSLDPIVVPTAPC